MKRASVVASTVLSVLTLLVWVVLLATLANLGSSDAAGNALARGFASLEIFLVWILLGVILIVETIAGAVPVVATLVAVGLLIASCVAAVSAVDLLADPTIPPYFWPILIPALVPPLVIAFGFWALLRPLRTPVATRVAYGVALGAVFVASILILPMIQIRDRVYEHEDVQRQAWADAFARLPADAPLWEVTPFLGTPDETRRDAVLERIRHLNRRQGDAATMLDRGDFPIAYLGSFDLDPTPGLCEKARGMLRRRAETLKPKSAGSRPYADIADEVAGAVAAMEWLVGYGCSCDAESQAWETMAADYRGRNFDVVRLREVRDPAALGQTLREDAAHFSMLTPQSHLRAWLKFAQDEQLREQALTGARKLDHRTDDAIEIMRTDRFGAYTLLMYLPELDLQTTPAFCQTSLQLLHDDFTPIYRPRPDDPRSYQELLGRLGIGRPLDALVWIASNGCDARTELREAEELVRSYLDSSERTAMLTRLAELRGN